MKHARVLLVNRYYFPDESATAQLLTDLAVELAARGFETHVICSRQLYDAPDARLPAEETVRGVFVHRIWTSRFGRRRLLGRALDYLSFYASCALVLMSLAGRSDLVIAETDPPLVALVAALVARIKGAKLVNWLQDVFPEVASRLGASPFPAPLDRTLRSWRDASLRFASMNVVIGRQMQDYLAARGIPKDKIRVIPNWAAEDAQAPKPVQDSKLRAALGLEGKFVVGYSGNLGRAHEYQIFLDAAAALTSSREIEFLFIGGGARMMKLQEGAASRQLTNMRFEPYQPRKSLADSLAAADVHLVSLLPPLEGLVLPSKFYGILAAARPVLFVGDRDGEIARLVGESGCGLVVPSGDAAALAAAILKVHEDAETRAAMGDAARALFNGRFTAQQGLASWVALVTTL